MSSNIIRNTWRKLNLSVLAVLLFFTFTISATDPVWLKQLKQLKPLETTRQDIELLFGKEEKEISGSWYLHNIYNTKFGKLRVFYSSGRCSEQKKEGFDVEKDILINVLFMPKKLVKFSSLNLDINEFSQYKESDTDNVFFTAKEGGIEYTVSHNLVNTFKVSPIKNQLSLSCKNQKK